MQPENAEGILFERRERIAWITFARQDARNAISFAGMERLAALLGRVRQDDDTRVVVLRGEGPDFSAGGDLKAAMAMVELAPEERSTAVTRLFRECSVPICIELDKLRQPVIASVRGHAIGLGFHLACASDLVIASETARFRFPYVSLGHVMDHGESYYLPRKIGMARSLQLLLTGDAIDASTAERLGIANWVVPDEQLEERTQLLARGFAVGAVKALYETKSLIRRAPAGTLQEQLAAEERSIQACAGSHDFAEALQSFIAKRKPQFQGR